MRTRGTLFWFDRWMMRRTHVALIALFVAASSVRADEGRSRAQRIEDWTSSRRLAARKQQEQERSDLAAFSSGVVSGRVRTTVRRHLRIMPPSDAMAEAMAEPVSTCFASQFIPNDRLFRLIPADGGLPPMTVVVSERRGAAERKRSVSCERKVLFPAGLYLLSADRMSVRRDGQHRPVSGRSVLLGKRHAVLHLPVIDDVALIFNLPGDPRSSFRVPRVSRIFGNDSTKVS